MSTAIPIENDFAAQAEVSTKPKVCPHCGQEISNKPKCNIGDCGKDAVYEGWYDAYDGMGIHSGFIKKILVCEEHKSLLRGGKF